MMKKETLTLILFTVAMAVVNAQDYQISFAGTGASTTVDSVEVQNLTQGISLTLEQGDVLYLKNTTTSIHHLQSDSEGLTIYPNPITESGTIEFAALSVGKCSVELYSLMGKKVLAGQYDLAEGNHQFKISGLQSGIFTLSVQSKNYSYSGKLVSKGTSQGHAAISYMAQKSTQTKSSALKSAKLNDVVEMFYADGDRLLIKGTSGIYSTVKSIVLTETTTETFEFAACTDGDDNNYTIVEIGDQFWMAENLMTTKYNDASDIPLVSDTDAWIDLVTPGYCWYNNDESTAVANGYGALYNWYTVDTDKLCPTGWHVPTDAEWTVLENYIKAEKNITEVGHICIELKAIMGWDLNGNGIDSYGFSVLPAGYRYNIDGTFVTAGESSSFWSSTGGDDGSVNAYNRYLTYDNTKEFRTGDNKSFGFSIRCVKD